MANSAIQEFLSKLEPEDVATLFASMRNTMPIGLAVASGSLNKPELEFQAAREAERKRGMDAELKFMAEALPQAYRRRMSAIPESTAELYVPFAPAWAKEPFVLAPERSSRPVKKAEGGEIASESTGDALDRALAAAREQEAYREMERYLKARGAVPGIDVGYLPGSYGEFQTTALPVGAGTIKVNEAMLGSGHRRERLPALLTHEMAHAVDRQIAQQAAEQAGQGNQFTEAFEKLVGPGGRNRAELARKLSPDWEKRNRSYRSSPKELAGHGMGAFAGKTVQEPAPSHVDATAATELAILMDLAQRNVDKGPKGLGKIPALFRGIGYAEGGEVTVPDMSDGGQMIPDVHPFQKGGLAAVEDLLKAGKTAKAAPGALRSMADPLAQTSTLERRMAQEMLPAQEADANLRRLLEPSKVQQRLYHGTTATEGGKGQEAIRRIKPSKEGSLGSGVYLTPSPAHASGYSGVPNDEALELMLNSPYQRDTALQLRNKRNAGEMLPGQEGGNMLPVYAQIKNPLVIEGTHADPMIEALVKLGMDEDKAARMVERAYENKGYIGKEVETRARAAGYDGLMQYRNGDLSEVVSYNPNAIKSAIGNRGTFDVTSPELSKATGGPVHFAKGKLVDVEDLIKAGKATKAAPTSPLKLLADPLAEASTLEKSALSPEAQSVIEKFGQKQKQEAARAKKVEKLAKQSAEKSADEPAKTVKSKGRQAAIPADYFRQMAETQGDEAVLQAAQAGEHLKRTGEGYVGAPRTVTGPQGLGAMRKAMDKDFADAVEAVRLADPERLGTWYDRAKQGIAESVEPYQLPRTLEQHGVYSAGVSPESELAFALKHLNSRVAGEPTMAYRGAGMRTLDEAVAAGEPVEMGFKIGEYAKKNDPRVPNTGLFGVNDFRRAQGMGYTDPQGNPWKAGVSETMHPFMDAETALQVERANAAGIGGRTDWAGPHIQEVPWVYGKGQDLYARGKTGRFGGDELSGIKSALREANNTARDYFYKHTGSATHEAVPGASTGHVPEMLTAPFEKKAEYGNVGRWDQPAPEAALNQTPGVGEGNRDVIYSALGYRQLPTLEASGAYFPQGSGAAEFNPVKIARPLMDFPTGGGGLASGSTRQTMNLAERLRALIDAQEAFGYNLPNTMGSVQGKNSLVMDTRALNPNRLNEPHTGVQPTQEQMAGLTRALEDTGYGVSATNRGATIFPFDPKATPEDARKLLKQKGEELEAIFPSQVEPSLNTSGYGPGVGIYTPSGFKASEPFSGQATMGLLKEASLLPEDVALGLSESDAIRRAIREKMKRDEAMTGARADIQETRRFFSEADWAKAVDMIRKGMTPAAALAAMGYSATSMAEEGR